MKSPKQLHSPLCILRLLRPLAAVGLLLIQALEPALAGGATASSKPIATVLKEPLPPETLALSTNAREWVISGPTFTYRVFKSSGVIGGIDAVAEKQEVLKSLSPADLELDGYRLAAKSTAGETAVVSAGKDKVVLRAQGVLRATNQVGSEVDYSLVHTFFDDGVVVSEVSLKPRKDLLVQKQLAWRLEAQGQFSHWLHKRRDEHGGDAVRGALPESGKAVRLNTLTSCLQVFSPTAGLALFTDAGATHLSQPNLDTAVVEVAEKAQNRTRLSLTQYVVHVAPGDKPYLLKGGEEFRFRVGLSVTPNRLAHPRMHDLRMFAWIGDPQYPYPTDQELGEIARAGYTVIQMHRLGTPGEPRPPTGELERVIATVHQLGMLFLWTENADLMYDSAPGVQELKAKGQWNRWQGFNYDGHYKATMDPYCDLAATCLASPNGLAEYRLATYKRMLERFQVDGIYLDDNLAYANCTLWREHGHPRPVYDCLIELHEMNWRRREFLRSQCPHVVLCGHITKALVLPVACDFDTLLYGEGYSFSSLENYWDYYRPVNGMPAQGMIWPGGVDPVRCPAALAYTYDLLTGGGQYCEIDWRLFHHKFPYAQGVTEAERVYVQSYNLAQYYFGLYESEPHYFADSAGLFGTSTPLTYATVYRNRVWHDWLIPVANLAPGAQQTALELRAPEMLSIKARRNYALFDTQQRELKTGRGGALNLALTGITIPGGSLRLFCLRELPEAGACHLWGGKRLKEHWDGGQRKLTLSVQGPEGVEETLFFTTVGRGILGVTIGGKPAPFFYDSARKLVHGNVTFTREPLEVEVSCARGTANSLPEQAVAAAALSGLMEQKTALSR
jgi:hypothetical protein